MHSSKHNLNTSLVRVRRTGHGSASVIPFLNAAIQLEPPKVDDAAPRDPTLEVQSPAEAPLEAAAGMGAPG